MKIQVFVEGRCFTFLFRSFTDKNSSRVFETGLVRLVETYALLEFLSGQCNISHFVTSYRIFQFCLYFSFVCLRILVYGFS